MNQISGGIHAAGDAAKIIERFDVKVLWCLWVVLLLTRSDEAVLILRLRPIGLNLILVNSKEVFAALVTLRETRIGSFERIIRRTTQLLDTLRCCRFNCFRFSSESILILQYISFSTAAFPSFVFIFPGAYSTQQQYNIERKSNKLTQPNSIFLLHQICLLCLCHLMGMAKRRIRLS